MARALSSLLQAGVARCRWSVRETFGDDQRQLFIMNHAGLPLRTVLEQLDILGDEVVAVLCMEFANGRPAACRPRRSTARCRALSTKKRSSVAL